MKTALLRSQKTALSFAAGAALIGVGQKAQAQSFTPSPYFEGFESPATGAGAYDPKSGRVSEDRTTPLGPGEAYWSSGTNYAGSHNPDSGANWEDAREGPFGPDNGIIQSVPSGYDGVTSRSGGGHGYLMVGYGDGYAAYGGPLSRGGRQTANPLGAGHAYASRFDVFLDSRGAVHNSDGLLDFVWSTSVSNSDGTGYLTESNMTFEARGPVDGGAATGWGFGGTYAGTPTLELGATYLNKWVTLEQVIDPTGANLRFVSKVWDTSGATPVLLGVLQDYTQAVASSSVGGPRTAFWVWNNNALGHVYSPTEQSGLDIDNIRVGVAPLSAGPTAQTYYWDVNSTAAGAGGPNASGNWNGTDSNFNTSSAGTSGTFAAAPTSADTVVFSAGSDATGTSTVTISGTAHATQINFKDGTTNLTGGTLAAGKFDVASAVGANISSAVSAADNAGAVLKTGAGTLAITSNPTWTGGTTVNGGTLKVTRLQDNNAVSIGSGAKLQVIDSSPTLPSTPSGDNAFVSRPGSLATPASIMIANDGAPLGSRVYNGTLDLGNNDLIIDYSGSSPYADFQDMLRSGYSGGTWTGTGVTSSTAANALANNNYALGIAENGTLVTPFGDGTGINPQFSGQTVDNTTVLIKFTHRADLNLDGVITSNDAAVFNSSYQQGASGATWQTGDLNYNGIWDSNDAAIFNSFYNESLSHLPEPTALGTVGLAGLLLARRSRSRRAAR